MNPNQDSVNHFLPNPDQIQTRAETAQIHRTSILLCLVTFRDQVKQEIRINTNQKASWADPKHQIR